MAVKMFNFSKQAKKVRKLRDEIELTYTTIYQIHPDDLENRMVNTGFRNDLERIFNLLDEGVDVLSDLSQKNYIDQGNEELPF